MEVTTLHWPNDAPRLSELRACHQPRLVLVAADADPPLSGDCLEDWIRLPAADPDVAARCEAVAERASHHNPAPVVTDEGIVRFRDDWAPVSPVERELAAELAERFGTVVGRDTLTRRAWSGSVPNRNAFDVHMLRLRRRLEPIGLAVGTVRGRGYLLEVADN